MPIIVFATSKGGSGKTTAAILAASELARQGADKNITVSLIDADPNQHSASWANKDGCPKNLLIKPCIDEDMLLDTIDEAVSQSAFVLIDLEGTANISVASSISRADMVVILCQGSQDDADEAAKTIRLIKRQSRILNREIPFSVLMNRTSAAITPRTLKYIVEQFSQAGISLFKTSLIDREAFRAIRSFGGTVSDLNPKEVSGIEKAAINAKAFTEELKQKIHLLQKEKGVACE
jgi:chromosome partitioning protein